MYMNKAFTTYLYTKHLMMVENLFGGRMTKNKKGKLSSGGADPYEI